MQDLTTGSLVRHLFATGGFMLFTMVFQTLYFLADLYWMGRLGKEAVAAVGVAGNLMFVVLALTQMLGVGTTTLVAHAVGRKDPDGARRVFNQAQSLSLLAGALFLVVGLALTPAYAAALRRRRGHGGAGPPVPVVVRAGDGAAVRARGACRRRCAASATSSRA